ncbi:hypothetical protein BDV98DRAFT_576192 [Pterulicium gracile]|uniref:Uncharacterized protein n=1 Tax=Pterulicium gracile TaxID=1884261 RepID=A0A5C3Q7N4_9AGAR|nr:hypothetical protein BDV98DRAFT_576192 [Pterula gracilis]
MLSAVRGAIRRWRWREERRIHIKRGGSRYERIGLCDFWYWLCQDSNFQLRFSAFAVWIEVEVESNGFPGDCQA